MGALKTKLGCYTTAAAVQQPPQQGQGQQGPQTSTTFFVLDEVGARMGQAAATVTVRGDGLLFLNFLAFLSRACLGKCIVLHRNTCTQTRSAGRFLQVAAPEPEPEPASEGEEEEEETPNYKCLPFFSLDERVAYSVGWPCAVSLHSARASHNILFQEHF